MSYSWEDKNNFIRHMVTFLKNTEEDVGVRVDETFLLKVLDHPVIEAEWDDLFSAHKTLVDREPEEKADTKAVDILDSFISRLYLYKMNYIFSSLWERGYASPVGVDSMGEVVYEHTDKVQKKPLEYEEYYLQLFDE